LPISTSLVAASGSLPYLLFGLLTGALADRGSRKRTMIGCDLFSSTALASVLVVSLLAGTFSMKGLDRYQGKKKTYREFNDVDIVLEFI
jgi:MFS family permease